MPWACSSSARVKKAVYPEISVMIKYPLVISLPQWG
jgi:hypothetical protein